MHLSERSLEAARVFILDLVDEASHAVVPIKDFPGTFGLAPFANIFCFRTFSSHVGQMGAESFVKPAIPAVVNARSRLNKACLPVKESLIVGMDLLTILAGDH